MVIPFSHLLINEEVIMWPMLIKQIAMIAVAVAVDMIMEDEW